MSELRPATEGFTLARQPCSGHPSGISCPDCGKEMRFGFFEAVNRKGKARPTHRALCGDSSHPNVAVLADDLAVREQPKTWRARVKSEAAAARQQPLMGVG